MSEKKQYRVSLRTNDQLWYVIGIYSSGRYWLPISKGFDQKGDVEKEMANFIKTKEDQNLTAIKHII